MAKKEIYAYPEKLSIYEKLITTFPNLERKGAKMPYTSVNGNMFSLLDENGMLGLRLPEAERNSFIKNYKTKLCEAHGTILKEYVLVPDNVFNNKSFRSYFNISLKYTSGLKSKAK